MKILIIFLKILLILKHLIILLLIIMRTLKNNVRFIIVLFFIFIFILVIIHYCKSNKKEHFTYGDADNVQELLNKRKYLSSKKIGPGLCVSSDSNNILNTFNYNKNDCEDICSNFSNCVGFTKSTNNSKNCNISIDQQYSKNVSVTDQFADIKNDGISAVNQDCYRSTRVLNSNDLQPFPVGLATENRGNCLYYAPHCPALESTNQKSVNGWYVDRTKEVDSYSKCNPGLLDVMCNKEKVGSENIGSENSKPIKVIAAFAPKISPPSIPDNYKLVGENNATGNCSNQKQIDKGYIGLNGCVQVCNSDQYCRSFTVDGTSRCNLVQDEPCNFNRSTNSSENNNTQWSFDKINLNINPPKTPNGYKLLPPNEKKTGYCSLDTKNKKIFNNLGILKGGLNECVEKCNSSNDCKNITINGNLCYLVNEDCKFTERSPVSTYGTQWTFKKKYQTNTKKSYVKFPGKNTYTGAGAINLDENKSKKMSLSSCQSYCDSDPACDCVVYRNVDNACWRRSNCNPDKFQKSPTFDVYVKQSCSPISSSNIYFDSSQASNSSVKSKTYYYPNDSTGKCFDPCWVNSPCKDSGKKCLYTPVGNTDKITHYCGPPCNETNASNCPPGYSQLTQKYVNTKNPKFLGTWGSVCRKPGKSDWKCPTTCKKSGDTIPWCINSSNVLAKPPAKPPTKLSKPQSKCGCHGPDFRTADKDCKQFGPLCCRKPNQDDPHPICTSPTPPHLLRNLQEHVL